MFGCMQGTRRVKSDEYSRLGWHLKDYSTAADFAPHPRPLFGLPMPKKN